MILNIWENDFHVMSVIICQLRHQMLRDTKEQYTTCEYTASQSLNLKRLKVSRTVPVYKAGSTENLSNYRPISCLPVISKIIEKLVCKRLYHYLPANSLLYDLQFGFQAGKSTVHPLIHILNYITKAINKNEFVISVFLDFQIWWTIPYF